MQIEITRNGLSVMARKLRSAVGVDAMTHSKSLEVLAETLGYSNWDTLCGVMAKVPEPLKPPAFESFDLYCEAFACDEWGDGPGWAKFLVDPAFINKVLELQQLVTDKGLDHVAHDNAVALWGNSDTLQIQGDELQVSRTDFWFHALPKHCDYAVETRMMPISDLVALATDRSFRSDKLGFADGIAFYDCCSAKQFAQSLLDKGNIDINESTLDEMCENSLN